MKHRGKISRDDDGRWAGVCDCSMVSHHTRWRDAFDEMFAHVRGRWRGQALGIGFTTGHKR